MFFVVFVRDEYFHENEYLSEFEKNIFVKDNTDFAPINSGIEIITYNYDVVLGLAVALCNTTLEPLFESSINSLVNLAFSPLLRLVDSHLYEII